MEPGTKAAAIEMEAATKTSRLLLLLLLALRMPFLY